MKVSVITINYNNRSGLEKTSESVVAQEYPDYEWIVIDGGSTDGSVEVIKSYERYIKYWCSCPDRGIYHAMNKGIAQASGDYCLFLNSGDSFHSPCVLGEFAAKVRRGGSDFVTGAVQIEGKNKKEIKKAPEQVTGRFIFKESVCHQSTFIKASVLRKNPYREDFKIVSDWLLMLEELLLHRASYSPMDTVVSNYNLEGISFTRYWQVAEERREGAKTVLGERLYNDYVKLCYGESIVEKVICRIEPYPFLKRLLNLFALVVFALYKVRKRF